MIILDELDYAKSLLKSYNYPKLKNLSILAKYFKYLGDKPATIRKKLIEYCHKNAFEWNDTLADWKIDSALGSIKNYKLRVPIAVPITKKEIENIKAVDNYDLEKFLFVLLAYAKILKYNEVRIKPRKKPKPIGFFYVNERSSILFRVAHVGMGLKERGKALGYLYDNNYIDIGGYGSFILKYQEENSEVEVMVYDYNNIVLYYQRIKGEKIAGCECGRLFLKKTSRHSLCPVCWKEKRRGDDKNRKREKRSQ